MKQNEIGCSSGLCRTCEIFGVDTLVLGNSTIVGDAEFKSLSMSAEKWVNIEQVKSSDLKAYLASKREKAGFTIIAAEQTTKSVPLETFQFPDKCVLLMGEEKEGVPAELIRYVDQPIEITQLGRVRSLNVHVTAALFIYRYASQKHF